MAPDRPDAHRTDRLNGARPCHGTERDSAVRSATLSVRAKPVNEDGAVARDRDSAAHGLLTLACHEASHASAPANAPRTWPSHRIASPDLLASAPGRLDCGGRGLRYDAGLRGRSDRAHLGQRAAGRTRARADPADGISRDHRDPGGDRGRSKGDHHRQTQCYRSDSSGCAVHLWDLPDLLLAVPGDRVGRAACRAKISGTRGGSQRAGPVARPRSRMARCPCGADRDVGAPSGHRGNAVRGLDSATPSAPPREAGRHQVVIAREFVVGLLDCGPE